MRINSLHYISHQRENKVSKSSSSRLCVCVCACVRACAVRACVRACVCFNIHRSGVLAVLFGSKFISVISLEQKHEVRINSLHYISHQRENKVSKSGRPQIVP